jgi:hypothetical protein
MKSKKKVLIKKIKNKTNSNKKIKAKYDIKNELRY